MEREADTPVMLTRLFARYGETLRSSLAKRHVALLLAGTGMVLTMPATWGGWNFDDYVHREIFVGTWPWPAEDGSVFGTFSFLDGEPARTESMINAGQWPWSTFPKARASFWRPLSEMTHRLDYQWWPSSPSLMHLQSVLWFGAVVFVVTRLYRKIVGHTWVAGLAALLFAVDNAHGLPVGYIAHRNTLLVAFFGGLALWAHVRWRQERWMPGAVWAPLCFSLALLSGETALSMAAYLFAYTLFLEPGAVRRRVVALSPYVVVGLAWALAYRQMGFGTSGIGAYVDPSRETMLFLRALVERAPILLFGQFAEPAAEIYGLGFYALLPHGNLIVWLLTCAGLLGLGFVLLPCIRHDAVTKFWALGTLLSLVPVCATFVHSRLLFFPGIGGAALVARFLSGWFEGAAWLPDSRTWRRGARILVVVFVLVHLVFAPLTLPFQVVSATAISYLVVESVAYEMPYGEDVAEKTVVLVNPPVAFWGSLYSTVRAAHGYPVPRRTLSLASGLLPYLEVTRVNANSIEIASESGMLQYPLDHLLRGPSAPMHVGERVELEDMVVEVLAVNDWQPSRVRFTFSTPLEDPSLCFLRWQQRSFVPYTFPPAGETERLPRVRLSRESSGKRTGTATTR